MDTDKESIQCGACDKYKSVACYSLHQRTKDIPVCYQCRPFLKEAYKDAEVVTGGNAEIHKNKCLKCDKSFKTYGVRRICENCKKVNSRVETFGW